MTDIEILSLSYKKPGSFGMLFDRHYEHFLKIARKSLRSKEDAEDATQEAFVRIYKYGKSVLESNGEFKPWAYKILRNCIIDQIRKYKTASLPLTEEIESTLGSDEEYTLFESEDYVESIFSKMDESGAKMLKLRFLLGKSYKEISKILGVNTATARVQVHRFKKIFSDISNKLNNYEKRS